MSREFDSLRTTSQLPDWITDEVMLHDFDILMMGGTHGDEQVQIEYVRSRMSEGSCPVGVLPIIANRAAADAALRSTGPGELMSWYPGRFKWETTEQVSNEELTAAGITWLAKQLKPGLIIDRHDNYHTLPYAYVGSRTTPGVLAAAYIMGHSIIQFNTWDKASKALPNYLVIEEVVPTHEEAKNLYCEQADMALSEIAELGQEGLTDYYFDMEVGERLTYMEYLQEVLLVDPFTGQPNAQVLSVLPELEELGQTEEPIAEAKLTERVMDVLQLDPSEDYYLSGSNYTARSPIISNSSIKLHDTVERRVCWGVLIAKRSKPYFIANTGELVFDNRQSSKSFRSLR